MEIAKIYEDNHIVVVIKPHNVEYEVLMHELGAKSVHRLDAVTGGVMVFAKTTKAAERLSEQIRNHEVEKKYLCVVDGEPKIRTGILKNYLAKDEHRNMVSVVPQTTKGAIYAELSYEVLATKQNLSFVRIELETGRSHQIRVQMQYIGCPLHNDVKYNPNQTRNNKITTISLWSYKMSFRHPTTNDNLVFIVHPEGDIWEVFREDFRFI